MVILNISLASLLAALGFFLVIRAILLAIRFHGPQARLGLRLSMLHIALGFTIILIAAVVVESSLLLEAIVGILILWIAGLSFYYINRFFLWLLGQWKTPGRGSSA